jgi:hypothetical protein
LTSADARAVARHGIAPRERAGAKLSGTALATSAAIGADRSDAVPARRVLQMVK